MRFILGMKGSQFISGIIKMGLLLYKFWKCTVPSTAPDACWTGGPGVGHTSAMKYISIIFWLQVLLWFAFLALPFAGVRSEKTGKVKYTRGRALWAEALEWATELERPKPPSNSAKRRARRSREKREAELHGASEGGPAAAVLSTVAAASAKVGGAVSDATAKALGGAAKLVAPTEGGYRAPGFDYARLPEGEPPGFQIAEGDAEWDLEMADRSPLQRPPPPAQRASSLARFAQGKLLGEVGGYPCIGAITDATRKARCRHHGRHPPCPCAWPLTMCMGLSPRVHACVARRASTTMLSPSRCARGAWRATGSIGSSHGTRPCTLPATRSSSSC